MTQSWSADDLEMHFERALPSLTDEDRRLARTIVGILTHGQPVATKQLAEMVGRSVVDVDNDLARLPWVFRNDRNELIGYGGAILLATPHRVFVNGRSVYASCAEDALILAMVLERTPGQSIRIESTCPTTRKRIRLTMADGQLRQRVPPSVAMSYPRPGSSGFTFSGDLVAQLCTFAHLFASEEAAGRWIDKHKEAFLLPLNDGLLLARWWAAELFGVDQR